MSQRQTCVCFVENVNVAGEHEHTEGAICGLYQWGEGRGRGSRGQKSPSGVQGRSPGRGFGEAEVFLLHLNKILTLPEIHFFCIIAVPLAGKILYKLLVNK